MSQFLFDLKIRLTFRRETMSDADRNEAMRETEGEN